MTAHDRDPTRRDQAPKRRIVGDVLLALGLMGAATSSAAVESIQHSQEITRDDMSAEEQRAYDSVHQSFEELSIAEIVNCEESSLVGLGPDIDVQGRELPSVALDVTLSPGTQYDADFYKDGGTTVGKYHAEIQWMIPQMESQHRIKFKNGTTQLPGIVPPIVRAKDDLHTSATSEIQVHGFNTPPVSTTDTYRVEVPINTRLPGERTVDVSLGWHDDSSVNIVETYEGALLQGSNAGGLTKAPAMNQLSCATFNVKVNEDGSLSELDMPDSPAE